MIDRLSSSPVLGRIVGEASGFQILRYGIILHVINLLVYGNTDALIVFLCMLQY